jgi:hypothetical protein
MKEKILEQLKIARGENTSISDRTLEKIADSLSVGITEETEIAAAVETYKPILTELAGNINAVAAQAVKDIAPVPPVPNPIVPPIPPIPPTPPVSKAPDWFKAHLEAQEKKDLLLTGKLEGFEKTKQTETLVAQAKTAFYTKYKVSEAEKALCDKSLDLHLRLNPTPESADKLIEGWKGQYEDIRSTQGMGGLELVGSNSGGGEDGAGKATLMELKEKLQREKKIPSSEKE